MSIRRGHSPTMPRATALRLAMCCSNTSRVPGIFVVLQAGGVKLLTWHNPVSGGTAHLRSSRAAVII